MAREPSPASGDVPRRDPAVVWIVGALAVFYGVTLEGYGVFRDELYYFANGEHLAFGYVDHPPMIGWVAAFVRLVLGQSLPAIRILPALAGLVTIWATADMARQMGGGRRAQILAALLMAVAPTAMSLFSFLSMNAFDVLFWAVVANLTVRLLRTGDTQRFIGIGIVIGLGLLNKISMLFLAFGLAAGLVMGRRWDLLRSRGFWLGGTIALALFAPFVIWQAAHGWPVLEFMANARAGKNVQFASLEFLFWQAFNNTGPVLMPTILIGLAFYLATAAGRPYRPIGWAYLGVLGLLIAAGSAKPYYMAPAYPMVFAGAARAIESWTSGRRDRSWVTPALAVLILLSGATMAPLAKALLPQDTLVRYMAWIGVLPPAEERHQMGRLPQHLADMHGWPELAADVAAVYRALPEADRERACIFGQNYGQAGAIDFFGPSLGLPKAISAHNSYWIWGPRECTADPLIVLGDRRERLEEFFTQVALAAVHTCRDCMPYENDLPIWVARAPREGLTLRGIWGEIKNFN